MGTPDLNSDDYYKVLGLTRDASDGDISKAYKKLALKWHPDKNPDNRQQAEANFKKVSEAYDVLHDPQKKKVFDQYGKAGLQGGGGGGEGGGFPGGAHFTFNNADDIFRSFFGGVDPLSAMFDDEGGGFMFRMGRGGGGRRGFTSMGGLPEMFLRHGGGGSSSFRRGRTQPQFGIIPEGTPVVIHGLQSSPQYNARQGKVLNYDSSTGRYAVNLLNENQEDSGTSIALKPSNFTQIVQVEICGVKSNPKLNGQRGIIVGFDEDKDRYTVYCEATEAMISLKPDSVLLPVSTCVVLDGLQSAPQHNGRWGTVLSIDEDAGRYVVQLEPALQLKVKPGNVRV